MTLTEREFWTLVHGMGLGAIFLLAFAGGLAGLYSMRPQWVTVAGLSERIRRLDIGTVAMAVVAWLTVISGAYFVYPWYRAKPPTGADLKDFPRYFLLDNPNLAGWHTFGMEWKEHVAWIAPVVATAIAFVVVRYGVQLAREPQIRRVLLWLFFLAFGAAGIAGLFGALITKAAPIL
jgi:hypothetical protein